MRKSFIILGILQLLLIISLIHLQFKRYNSPKYFPLDDPKGTYTIVKQCPGGQGWSKSYIRKSSSFAYCIEYEGDNVFDPLKTNSHFYRVTVGKTNQDLSPYVGKKITIQSGEFLNTSLQCIKDNPCITIEGLKTALNIYAFTLK